MTRGDPITFDLDADDVRLFCEEAVEHLDAIEESLVRLESDSSPGLLQQIFRAAHTLKGSAATIGHTRMETLTHAMESVLEAFRQGTASPDHESIDALLAALDLLRELAGEVNTGVDSGADAGTIEARLMALTEAFPLAPEMAAVETPGPEPSIDADGAGSPVQLAIAISKECLLPSIRVYQVLRELDAHGIVTETIPAREVVESGGAGRRLVVTIVTTVPPGDLRRALFAVADVESVEFVEDLLRPAGDFTRDRTQSGPGTGKPPKGPNTSAPGAVPLEVDAAPRAVQSIRIDVERLDALMSLVGELAVDHARLRRLREQLSHVLQDAGLGELAGSFEETTEHLGRVTYELQEQLTRSRVLPIRSVLARLPRIVRDVARKCGKRVELVVNGEETELDRVVIEVISDPLVHILRNAIDHGIETPAERLAAGKREAGTVTITASNHETHTFVSIADDGRGIDAKAVRRKAVECGLVSAEVAAAVSDDAALQYILIAGLSTADVVSDISGRGVGMDVVRTNIERLDGQVQVRSTPGRGSEITLQLPRKVATTKALIVRSGGTTYAIPLVTVSEAIEGSTADISNSNGLPALRLRNQLIPVVDLDTAPGERNGPCRAAGRFVVVVLHGNRLAGLLADDLLGEQDVVVRSPGSVAGNRHGLAGTTVLGDGNLALVVDVASLAVDRQQSGYADRAASEGVRVIELERPALMKAFSSVARDGAARAGRGLSGVVGQEIRIHVPDVRGGTRIDACEAVGGAGSLVLGAHTTISGDIAGHVMLLFPQERAFECVDLMCGVPAGTTSRTSALAESAISELGNIVGSAFVNALADRLGLVLHPSPPVVVHGKAVDLVESVYAQILAQGGEIVMVDTVLEDTAGRQAGLLLVAPDSRTLEKIQELAA